MNKTRGKWVRGMVCAAALSLPLAVAARGNATGAPIHQLEAEALVATIEPADNIYNKDSVVSWVGTDAPPSNRTVCSQFVSRLIQHTYGYTESDFYRNMGSTSPTAAKYHDWFIGPQQSYSTRPHRRLNFVVMGRVGDWQPGDFIAIKNIAVQSSSTGHVAMIAAAPQLVSETNGIRKYEVLVIDSSSSYHGADDTRKTRPDTNGPDNGVGAGKMVVFADAADDQVVGHCWSTSKYSTFYDQTQKSLVVGRLVIP